MKYIIEICIAIDIAILGIAYPILIDKISNIGQKYNSEYLPNVFDSTLPDKRLFWKMSFFQIILFLTLLSFVFQIFWFEPFEVFKNNLYVENSADILVFTFTSILTITFLYWINKIMLYQGKASDLLVDLVRQYQNTSIKKEERRRYLLKTINEFAIYAIEQQDKHLQTTLVEFYLIEFAKFREKAEPEVGAVYPFDLYNITNEIIFASIATNNVKLKTIEHLASSGIWLLGQSFTYSKISKETYSWLWRNIVQSSQHSVLIANYWASASQHFNYSLAQVDFEYNEEFVITNQNEIDSIKEEKVKFLELNIALGGLLYYQKNIKSLKYILTFSQSQPPDYPLLPQSMDDIFYWFEYFSNDFKTTLDQPLVNKYYFPELDNLGTSRNVTHYICMYISILFVRQFTLQEIYVYQNFKDFYRLKDDLQELYSLNNKLKYFNNCIEKVLNDDDLLNELSFTINKQEIRDKFEDLSKKIQEKIDLTKLNAQISNEKIEQFNTSTKEIIKAEFSKYKSIENKKDFKIVDKSMISSIIGELIVSSKSSFTDNDIPNVNFDTVYANHIAHKINYFLPNSFLMARTLRYLIESNLLIEGLNKILDSNYKNKIIVGIRPNYKSIELISKSKFHSIFLSIPSTNNYLNDTFFILDKKDLPSFEYRDLQLDEIEKFNLEKIDNDINLYTSILDINLPKYKYLKDEYITSDDDDELKVLILISFIFLIKWKKKRNIIMLSLTNQFQERGIVNNLNDLEPIKDL